MSVAAAGGSDDGNGGGDKKGKGKWNIPESLPTIFEEEMDDDDDDEPPPSYGVENLHSLKQNLPNIEYVLLGGHKRRLKGNSRSCLNVEVVTCIRKRKRRTKRFKHYFFSRRRKARASSKPKKHKDDHHDHDDFDNTKK